MDRNLRDIKVFEIHNLMGDLEELNGSCFHEIYPELWEEYKTVVGNQYSYGFQLRQFASKLKVKKYTLEKGRV